MNTKIKTYYIPTNPHTKKGPIYTLYLNNNTNLDLSSIIENTITLNNILNPSKENKIIIEEQDYQKILDITSSINKYITELTKLNTEYQNIFKKISTERNI